MRHEPFLIIETPIGIFSKIWNIINDCDTITHQYKTLNTADEKNEGGNFEDFEWTVNCFKPHELLKTARLLLKTAQKLWLEVGGDLVIAPFLLGPQQKCSIPQRSQRKMLQHGAPPKKHCCFLWCKFCRTKSPFFEFFENFQNWQFWLMNFSKKAVPTEKTKYTMMTARENPTHLSSQIFDFWTFVTEIFRFKVRHISFFWKFQKMEILTNLAAKLLVLP